MRSAAIQSGHGNYNRMGHLSLREEGWVRGSKVGFSLQPSFKPRESCVFLLLITMFTIMMRITNGDITFETHVKVGGWLSHLGEDRAVTRTHNRPWFQGGSRLVEQNR